MTPSLVVPTYALGYDAARLHAWQAVREHLRALSWPLVLGCGSSPAAARNSGARVEGGDVLVFCDADTLVPLAQIREAAALAMVAPGLVFAFDEYRRLGELASAHVSSMEWALAADAAEAFREPPSHGCVAISRACFAEAGGYDERLEVFEDCAFSARCAALWPLRRVEGPAVHLWHPRPLGEPGSAAYEARFAASRAVWEAEYPWPVSA